MPSLKVMKQLGTLDAALLTALLALSLSISQPGWATAALTVSGATDSGWVAQKQAQVNLNLTVEKQVLKRDAQGRQVVEWVPLQGNVTVQPGDVLRYSFVGKNVSDRSVKNLVVTQPIPTQMLYVPGSAMVTGNVPVKLTYSIDQGKTFAETPMRMVRLPNGTMQPQPAPPSAYTHVRWIFPQSIDPRGAVIGSFRVRVR